jgi:hypothetical protein
LLSGGFLDAVKGIGNTIMDGDPKNIMERNVGLFLHCKVIAVFSLQPLKF